MTTGIKLSRQLAKASGPIEMTLKNDMMFHMVMARTPHGLKGLICALKGFREEEVRSVTLLNPISYDEYLEKEIIVDTLVELNNNEILNIELQIDRDPEWIRRSLLYLCRAYDNIKGERKDYDRLKPTTHIGILDHDLFPESPEFYAKYLLTNVNNGHVYTTIFGMNVLSLKRTELATEEDKASGLDYWAEVFRAETWEELRRLAVENRSVTEVAEAMYQVSADDHARSILRARRKFEEVHTTAIEGRARAEAERDAAVKRLDAAIERLDETIAERDAAFEARDEALEARDEALEARDEAFEARDEAFEARDEALRELAEARAEIERIKSNQG